MTNEEMTEWLRSKPSTPLQIEIADALEAKDKRIEKLSEAIGFLTTLNPDMEIDADNPVRMAIQIVTHVDARIAELKAALKELADEYEPRAFYGEADDAVLKARALLEVKDD